MGYIKCKNCQCFHQHEAWKEKWPGRGECEKGPPTAWWSGSSYDDPCPECDGSGGCVECEARLQPKSNPTGDEDIKEYNEILAKYNLAREQRNNLQGQLDRLKKSITEDGNSFTVAFIDAYLDHFRSLLADRDKLNKIRGWIDTLVPPVKEAWTKWLDAEGVSPFFSEHDIWDADAHRVIGMQSKRIKELEAELKRLQDVTEARVKTLEEIRAQQIHDWKRAECAEAIIYRIGEILKMNENAMDEDNGVGAVEALNLIEKALKDGPRRQPKRADPDHPDDYPPKEHQEYHYDQRLLRLEEKIVYMTREIGEKLGSGPRAIYVRLNRLETRFKEFTENWPRDPDRDEAPPAVPPECQECDGEGVVCVGEGEQTDFGPCPRCHTEPPEPVGDVIARAVVVSDFLEWAFANRRGIPALREERDALARDFRDFLVERRRRTKRALSPGRT